jgi:hypothetical protein
VTLLNDSNFIATVVKSPSFTANPLPYGTVTIRYNSPRLLQQVKEEIPDVAEEISET